MRLVIDIHTSIKSSVFILGNQDFVNNYENTGSGALVEPQSASRQVINQDLPQELPIAFSHLDPVPDDSSDADYVPSVQ
ncbi:hypothetical protein ACN42_g1446 [Penicillium freii]|uniref:Uncharacterized protein n=1 Tax=Penicillium freii TaxID=48697 RepID=A0A117NRG9_PENFR|nr:hypothetical protein ACN42_g1446 [Penicillium freii]